MKSSRTETQSRPLLLEFLSVSERTHPIAWLCLAMVAFWSGSALVAQHAHHDMRVLREDPRLADGQIAPLLSGLGSHHMEVTTSSPRAQLFFDQGLRLTYGFNHREALRAFKEAVRLDPDCGMAYWGWALTLGPNLNLPMQAEAVPQAYQAIQMALSRLGKVSEKEADLIRALAKRYADEAGSDRSPLDQDYADAMRELHRKYPDDADIATLFAAALMNLSPWSYWTPDGHPREYTPEILETLRAVMESNPHHEGALHYWIHAVEAVHPDWGEAAADALRGRAPGAGHLTHMPSHIYMQLGRYSEAYEVNQFASLADESYITQCRAQGIYPLGYYPHNIHFLVWAGMMLGRSQEVLHASRQVASNVPADFKVDHWAIYETFLSLPLYTMVRFGMWDAILQEPVPPGNRRFWNGISHYARGLAYAAKNRFSSAQEELAALSKISDDPATEDVLVGVSNAATVLEIAQEILAGEIAGAREQHEQAITHLERAVRLQDGMGYTEPPDWYYPVRHSLGAALLAAGRPREAETVYWQDLRRYPENPYSLFGLGQSLQAQGREEEAAKMQRRFERAWAHADVELISSRW